MTNKKDSIISVGVFVGLLTGSAIVGCVAGEITYNTGKKIIGSVYRNIILKK